MRASVAARPLVGGPGLGRTTLVLGAGLVLVVVASLAAVAIGSAEVGLGDAIGIIAQRLGLGVTETWAPTAPTILFEVRLPRVLAGLVVGSDEPITRLCLVGPPSHRLPPEPFRYLGARVIRRDKITPAEAAQKCSAPIGFEGKKD